MQKRLQVPKKYVIITMVYINVYIYVFIYIYIFVIITSVKAVKKLLPVKDAFLVFENEKLPGFIEQNPGISNTGMMRLLGSSWIALSKQEKEVSLFYFAEFDFCL